MKEKRKMIKCCIFDLDGTLLNTITTLTHYVNLVLLRRGIDKITEDECRRFVGNGARLLITRALASKGIDDTCVISSVLEEFSREYNSDTTYLTHPYDGICEMLSELRERGVLLGVVSNKPDAITSLVISKMFPDTFSMVRGGIDEIPLKPAPDNLLAVIEALGALPCEVIYVGDTGVDIETGKRAKVLKTVGVSWGFRPRRELFEYGADVVIDTPSALIKEVERLA